MKLIEHFQNLTSIQLPSVQIMTTSSNMISLEKFQTGEIGDAAIIPQSEMSGLQFPLMKNHVADQDDNNTRFIIFKNQPANLNELSKQPLDTNHFKAPLFVTPSFNDQPGTLYKILGYFAKAKLNLITLMSLPTKTELGVYSFYIEVSGTRDQQEEIFATLKELASTYHVHLLGFYAV